MSVELNVNPDLASKEVKDFLLDTTISKMDEPAKEKEQDLKDDGFELSKVSSVGVASNEIVLYSFLIKRYYVIEKKTGAIVAETESENPVSHDLDLGANANVWLKASLGQKRKQELIAIFDVYDPSSGVNPNQYAYDAGAKSDEFYVQIKWDLTKKKTATNLSHDVALEAFYKKSESELALRLFGEYLRADLKGPSPGEHDVGDPEKPIDTIKDVIAAAGKVLDCTHLEEQDHRIGTLFEYPEFRIEWERKRIKIGCVKITLRLPVLEFRTTKMVLWAFVGIPKLDKLVKGVVERCFVESAVASTIIGLATANLAVAGAAFKSVFVECIERKIATTISCLISGLVLLKKKGGWKPV